MTDQEELRTPRRKSIGTNTRDQDKNKGATEENQNGEDGNAGMQNQLGHRDETAELKDADSGLPG
jgi:hypothetical protein